MRSSEREPGPFGISTVLAAAAGRDFHAVSIAPAPAFLSRPLPLDLTPCNNRQGVHHANLTHHGLRAVPGSASPTGRCWSGISAEDHNRRPEPEERPSRPPPDEEAASS